MTNPKSITVTGSPETIWLVYGDLEHDDTHANVTRDGEVLWCEDPQFPADVKYVRADRLAAVEAELESTKKALALVQQHHATAWNRGHEAGMRASRDTVRQATDAVKRDAWGNTQLTEVLLATEAERDRLSAELAAAREEPLTDAQRRVLLFLQGIGELDGVGYGERPAGAAPYWWRTHLQSAFHGITSSKEGQSNG